VSAAPVTKAVAAHAIAPRASGRPWTFYVLLPVFILYVLALYGPMIASISCRSKTFAAVWFSR
jgi:hypothetical protein